MKTGQFARSIGCGIALLGAIGLAGCSGMAADEGAAGEGEIGSAEQALCGTAPSAAAAANSLASGSQERQLAASCKIHDAQANKDYFVMAGGLDPNGGAVTDDILVSEPGAAWTSLKGLTPSVHLTSAVLDLAGITDPSDPSKCIFAGGAPTVGGAAVKKVDVLHVNNGTWTVTPATDLNVARSRFALSFCDGNSKLVAFGGQSSGTQLDSIEVSTGLAPTAWTNYNSGTTVKGLINARSEFGFAKNPGVSQYLITGGKTAGGPTDAIELVSLSTVNSVTCVPSRVGAKDNNNAAVTLTNQVQGNVAFYEGTANTFISTAGSTTAALPRDEDKITVGNWATGLVTLASTANALPVGTYLPTLVETETNGRAHMLIGGGNDDAPTAAIGSLQQYQSTNGAACTPVWTSNTLQNARFGAVAVFFPGVNVFAAGGTRFVGSPVFPIVVENITP